MDVSKSKPKTNDENMEQFRWKIKGWTLITDQVLQYILLFVKATPDFSEHV